MLNILLGVNLLLLIGLYWGIRLTINEIRGIHFTCGCSGMPIRKDVLAPRPGGRVKRPMKIITDEQLHERGE